MFLLKLLSRLPFPVLYAISDFLFFVSFYVARYRRKMVRKNLRNAFPEKSREERRKIEIGFYKSLCDYGVEMIKLLTLSKQELQKRMRFVNPEVVQEFIDKRESILFLASHQFNWEWMLVSASATLPIPIEFVYQPVNSRFFDDFSRQTRTRFNALAIKRDEVAREIVKRRDLLRGIANVADQYPGYGRDKKFITKFLSQDTVFFYGTNQLAVLTQYPVIYFDLKKIRRGYYIATPVVVGRPPYKKNSDEVIDTYVRLVEKTIRENPTEWLWSHNRWKKRHLKEARKENQDQASI